MSPFRRSVGQRRRRALGRAAPGSPLADALAVDPPDLDTALDDLPLLAVDLETTGLDPARHRVLSAGWVPVDGRRIVLAGARLHRYGQRRDHRDRDGTVPLGAAPLPQRSGGMAMSASILSIR